MKKTTQKKKAVAKKATGKTTKKKVAKKVKKAGTTKKTAKSKAKKKTAKKVVKKKKAAKKATRRRTRVRRSGLSKTELEHYRNLLVEKLSEILGDVNHIEFESLRKSRLDASGDLSSMPIHMADIGSDNYEQEFALGLMDGERKIVQEILAALKRIEAGVYGICEGTGDPIPKARLEGIPWARYCVKYAEMIEKGLVTEEDNRFSFDDEDEYALDESEEMDSEDESDDDYDDEENTDDEDDDRDPFYYHFADEDEDEEDDESL